MGFFRNKREFDRGFFFFNFCVGVFINDYNSFVSIISSSLSTAISSSIITIGFSEVILSLVREYEMGGARECVYYFHIY
jgi:hypothetical protein